MNRSVATLALAATLACVGCNNPVCGPGTKQHQKSNGDIECQPTDIQMGGIECDVDGGATIVAGKCVSAITCGPNTKLENGQCVGTGGSGMHVPDACPTPTAGKICINGVVRHLVDNSFLDGTEMVRVAVYDPLRFLANPTVTPLAEVTTNDTYTFKDVPTPAVGLVAVAVTDPTGTATQVLQITGSGAVVTSGQKYQIDTYATPKAVVDMWSTQAGVDYDAMGAYVLKYYLDQGPDPHLLKATETSPASGVQVTMQTGLNVYSVVSTAKYFSTDLMTIGSGTSTSSIGAGIVTGTGTGNPPTYSGKGNTPADNWEHHPGDSTAHVVFVDRFHPCALMSGMCTN